MGKKCATQVLLCKSVCVGLCGTKKAPAFVVLSCADNADTWLG